MYRFINGRPLSAQHTRLKFVFPRVMADHVPGGSFCKNISQRMDNRIRAKTMLQFKLTFAGTIFLTP